MLSRDPDLLQILDRLTTGLAELKANVISRWGRIPHTAADPASPPDGSTWIRSDNGNLSWRANAVTHPTAWTAPTLAGAWVNFGGTQQVAQYRMVGDRVFLRGVVKTGVIGTAVFTLPAGFRPPSPNGDLQFTVSSNSAFGVVGISPAGVVTALVGNNAAFWLGCDFSTIA